MQRWYSVLLPRSARSIAWLAILIVFALGFLALVGWMLDITLLKSIGPQWISMHIITAICFILCAIDLALLQKSPSAVRKFVVLQAPGVIVGLVGLLTIVVYAIVMIIGQEPSLGSAPFLSLFWAPETRMALLTAILFLISGCALVLLAIGSHRTAHIAHALMLPGALVSYMVPASYLLGVQSIHEWLNVPVALNTGLAFCALCVAIFCARPDTWLMSRFTSDRSGSVMARQLLPALLMLPLVVGWLRLHGERAGYFESAVGVVLVAVTYAACFVFLLWLSARSVNRMDDKRQTAVEELRKSEEKYRNLFENMAEEVHFWKLVRDENGEIKTWRVVDVNPPAIRTWGRKSREETIGRLADEIYPGATDHYMPIVQKIMTEGVPYSYEDYFPPPVDKHFRFTSVPLGEYFITTGADITDIKKVQEAIQKSEERYHSVLDNSRDVIYRVNLQTGRYEYISPAVQTVVGFSPDELMAQDFETGLTMIHPDDMPAMRVALARLEETDQTKAEYRQRAKSGEYKWLSNYMSLIKDGTGRPLYRDGNIRDITESKQAEEDLKRHREHLEELVMQRTQELEDKNLQLHKEMIERVTAEEEKNKLEIQLIQAKRMEALGKLAGGIAHDLNNMLQPILINSEMISDKLIPGTQEREYLDQIIDAAQFGKSLIKQIKMFGSSQKPILKPIPIGQVVHKALTIVKRTLSSDIKLNQHVPMNEHLVNADPIQINQLVLNLCSNAVQSMTPQGGTLDVSLDETVVIQSTPAIGNDLNPGKYMILTVRDTGSGIEPEIMKNIFEPFFTTRKSDKGTGLGLAVVYEVVKNSQGSILLYSEVGKGTSFEIFFPLHLDSLN